MASTTLTRRSPFPAFALPPIGLMRNRLRNLMDEPLYRFLDEPNGEEVLPESLGWYPAVDVTESPTEFIFTAEIPGMKREDVKISWENDLLTIRGEKAREVKQTSEDKKVHLFERTYGTFQRSFTIPQAVVGEKIVAEMVDGILTVKVPKAPETISAAKKIEIKVK